MVQVSTEDTLEMERVSWKERTTHYCINLWYLYMWKIMSINPLAIRLHCRHSTRHQDFDG